MEDEFYNLAVKGNDLKTYVRRFQELADVCPNMVPNTEKLMEVFIRGLPRSIEGNVTALKPQTLEEAITITQRLMEQVIKHNSAQETNDHKRKFEDRRNTTDNNNYPNDRNNNNHSNNHNNDNYQNNHNNHNRNDDYHQQQNRRQETIRTYVSTPTKNKSVRLNLEMRFLKGWGTITTYFFPPEDISPPKDTENPVESPILVTPSSSVGSSSLVRSTTPPPDYPFDASIFAELDNSLWIIPRPLGSEPVPEEPDESDTCYNMPPKRTSTSETPTMTQAAIWQLIADGIAAALEAQAATMENTNRN
ncbi:hypothetical protein Tco_0600663 [Tanacetum coccineum]